MHEILADGCYATNNKFPLINRKVLRYERSNQKPSIGEGQSTQWTKKKKKGANYYLQKVQCRI